MARKMKNSGIDWIGEIPQNAKIMQFRYIADISTGDMDTQNRDDEGIYPFYVRSPKIERSNSFSFDDIEAILMAGDGVGAGRVFHYVQGKYGCHQRVYRMNNFRYVNSKFMKYYLQTLFPMVMDYGSAKSTVDSVRLPMLKSFWVVIFDESVQAKIVDFLDEKIEEIDSVISLIQKNIEDYKKYKQAIITEIITRGVNSETKLNNSEIEWIGEIPEHWKTIKIKYTSFLKGRIGWQGLKSDEYMEEGAYLITGTDFNNGIINWNSCVHISDERFEEAPEIHIVENDLLITKDGTIGKVAIAKNCPEKVSLNSGVLLIRNTKDFKYFDKYLYYVLLSDQFWNWYEMSQTGNSTIKHLYQEQFYNFEFSYPPLKEQKEIAEYLDIKCAEIDNLISKKEALVADLEEYKKSLIYEYVTGKKEVPEEKVIPFPAIVNCKNKRFAQAVLLTKVLDELGEYHSGRVKVAKTLYVLENHIGFDFEVDPLRKVAGPLDKQYYDAEAIVRHNNWFNVLEDTSNVKFFVGKDKDKYLDYYDKYFKEYDSEIQRIIDVFKNLNMNEAELLATAYASWNDFIIKGESFNKDDIVEDIFAWDDSKKRFPKEAWLGAIAELEAKGLSPLGHGKITILDKE